MENPAEQESEKRQQDFLTMPPKAELPAIPEYIAAEVFLENSGYFTPSSKRIKNVFVKEKVIGERENPDGTKRVIKTKIIASYESGLPITSDLDYYRAFLKICDEIVDRDGRFNLPIPVPTKKLIRYTGKTENARVKKEARAWLQRMTLTGIQGAIFRAKHKDYEEGFIGTVFSQVFIKGDWMKNGKIAETNYVWPAPWFLSNYYYRHLRPIDFNLYLRLRKPIAKALYSLLETGWYAANGLPYSKSYHDLCDEFLLTQYHHLTRIQQQLDPSHLELYNERFLGKWKYRRVATRDDWIITYHPGPKFFDDQQARRDRCSLAKQIQITQKPQLPLLSDDRQEYLLTEILAVCQDHQNRAAYRKAIQDYSEDLIWMTISETRQAALERRIKKTNGAYFMDTLKRLSQFRVDAEKVPAREEIIGQAMAEQEQLRTKNHHEEQQRRGDEAKQQQQEAEQPRRRQAAERRSPMTAQERQVLRQQAEARIPEATKQVVDPQSGAYAKMLDAHELDILVEQERASSARESVDT